jgi:hypothetical protein
MGVAVSRMNRRMAIWPTLSRSVIDTRKPYFSIVRAGVPRRSNGHSVNPPSMFRLKRLRMYKRTRIYAITFHGRWHAPGSLTR